MIIEVKSNGVIAELGSYLGNHVSACGAGGMLGGKDGTWFCAYGILFWFIEYRLPTGLNA